MRLDEYRWSHNPRGLHVASAFQTPVEFDRYSRPHMGWVKLLAATTDYVDDAVRFQEMGITPIVRLYLGEWGAKPFDSHLQSITDAFINAGREVVRVLQRAEFRRGVAQRLRPRLARY